MSMIRFTVEETNLLSIYNGSGKRALIEKVNAALPYMDEDMREFAKRTLSKVDALTEEEFAGLALCAADEV
jgi:ABC-type molybdenum transport system ATPase subunit/photorepair protein PhrA